MNAGEVFNTATVAGTIAGYAGGQILEQMRQHQIAQNRQAAVPAHGNVEAYKDRMSLLRRGVAALACFGAVTGYMLTQGTTTTESYHQDPAGVVLDIDHTAKTLDGTADKINATAGSFLSVDPKTLHETTIVAHNSTSEVIPLKDLAKDHPFGQSTFMANATTSSFAIASSNAATLGSNAIGSAREHTAAVVAFTDGNSLGDVQADNRAGVPVIVVNFDDSNKQIVVELKADAKETGGKYIDAQSANPKDIAKTLKADVMPRPVAEKSTSDRLPWLVGGVALGLATLREGFRRRRQTVRETVR